MKKGNPLTLFNTKMLNLPKLKKKKKYNDNRR